MSAARLAAIAVAAVVALAAAASAQGLGAAAARAADQLTREGIMRDHAEVLGCFERWRIEPREYTLAHIAFYRAIEDANNLHAVADRLSPIRKQNARFLLELDDNGTYYFREWTTKESALVEQRKRRQ